MSQIKTSISLDSELLNAARELKINISRACADGLRNEVYEYQVNLLKRKEDVIRLIDEKGMLTDEIKNNIMNCALCCFMTSFKGVQLRLSSTLSSFCHPGKVINSVAVRAICKIAMARYPLFQ